MRTSARALALTTGALLLVGLTPAAAFAAADPNVTATAPTANGGFVKALDGTTASISVTFSSAIVTAQPATITATEAGDPGFACSQAAVSAGDTKLACTPSGFKDGVITVTYSATLASVPPATDSGSFSFTLDTVAPSAPSIAVSPTTYDVSAGTAHSAVTVSGASEAGDKVDITLSSSGGGTPLAAQVVAGTNGAYSTAFAGSAVSGLGNGTLTASARSTDPATNQGPAATATLPKYVSALTLMSTSPVDGGSEQPGPSGSPNGYTAVGSHTLAAGSTITLTDATNAQVATTTSFPTAASVEVVPAAPLPEGTYTAVVHLVDPAGNVAPDATRTFTIDNTPPAVPTVVATDPVNIGNVTSASVTGVTEKSAVVSLAIKDGVKSVTGSTTAGAADGSYSFPHLDLSSLADGTLSVAVTATDAAGNASPKTITVTKDTTAPAAPATVVLSPTAFDAAHSASDLVVSGTDTSADRTNGDTLVADVTVSDADPATADLVSTGVPVDGSGAFSATFLNSDVQKLSDGTLTVSVVLRDVAGNTGPATTTTLSKEITPLAIQSTSPAAGAVVQPQAAVSAVFNEALSQNTNAGSPPYSKITVTNKLGTPLAGALTFSNGGKTLAFTPSSAFAEAGSPYTVTVHGTDASSSGDIATATYSFTVDSTPPAVPTATATNPVNLSKVKAVSVTGTTEKSAAVTLAISDGTATVPASTTASALDGSYSFTGLDLTALADGPLTVTVTATDAAGNTSTNTADITKDVVAPVVPTVVATDPVNAGNVKAVSVTGATEKSAAVTLAISDGTATVPGSTTASAADGSYSFTGLDLSSLADGSVTVTVTATDAAGNTSTKVVNATKDTVAPVVPTVVATNPVNGGNVTAASVTGTTEKSASVALSATDGTVTVTKPATPASAANGSYAFTGVDLSSLADGSVTVTVTATDASGNSSTKSVTVTKDVIAPVVPTVTATNPVNGSNVKAATVTGTTEKSAHVALTVFDGTKRVPASTTASATDGSYSFTALDLSSLAEGPLSVAVTATDAAGNASTKSVTVTKDTVAPTVSGLAATVSDYAHPASKVTGTVSEAATVVLSATDGTKTVPGTATVSPNGSFSGTLDLSSLAGGPVTVKATPTDVAGNLGAAITTTTTRDTATPPSAPAPPHVVAGDRKVTVTFTAPTSDGGAAITAYRVKSSPAGVDLTVSSPVTLVAAASNGTTYTFTVTATNRVGGTTSAPSTDVTPLGVSSVAFNAIPSKITYGGAIVVSGVLHRTDTSVPADPVFVLARNDNGTVDVVKLLTPSSTGAVSITLRPSTNRSYALAYFGDDKNDVAFSAIRRTLVAVKVSVYAPSGSHTLAQVITGTVSPNKAGRVVTLYRVSSTGALVKVASTTLTSKSTYRFAVKLPRGYTTLEVYVGTTPNNVPGFNRFRAFRT